MFVPDTVTEAVAHLRELGYADEFAIDEVPAHDGATHPTTDVVIREEYRFEGATDPGDEAIVLGVECTACGRKGIVVSAYGPTADRRLLALIEQLDRRLDG